MDYVCHQAVVISSAASAVASIARTLRFEGTRWLLYVTRRKWNYAKMVVAMASSSYSATSSRHQNYTKTIRAEHSKCI